MTTHVDRSTVRREVLTLKGTKLIVTLAPEGIYTREKGRRTAYLAPYGAVHQRAVLAAIEADRRARANARRNKRRKGD